MFIWLQQEATSLKTNSETKTQNHNLMSVKRLINFFIKEKIYLVNLQQPCKTIFKTIKIKGKLMTT